MSPDLITFKGISHLRIILQDSGELCQVKQRGGLGARKRRNENRQERIEKKPIGQEEEDVKKEEDEKDIDNEEQKHRKKLEELRKKLEELRNKNKNRKAKQHHMDKNVGNVQYPAQNVGTNVKVDSGKVNKFDSAKVNKVDSEKVQNTPDRALDFLKSIKDTDALDLEDAEVKDIIKHYKIEFTKQE